LLAAPSRGWPWSHEKAALAGTCPQYNQLAGFTTALGATERLSLDQHQFDARMTLRKSTKFFIALASDRLLIGEKPASSRQFIREIVPPARPAAPRLDSAPAADTVSASC